MHAKQKYNDNWIGYYFIPFAAIFVYYIGKGVPFVQVSFETRDLIYIVLNIVSGLILWQIIKKIIFSIIKDKLTLSLFLKAFILNLVASLSFLIISRYLHDLVVSKRQTNIDFYTIDLPTDVLFILIINLIYLILFYKARSEQQSIVQVAEPESTKTIVIQSSKKSYVLAFSDIALIELENKTTFVYTHSSQKIVTIHTLNEIFQKLPESKFFLANRQFVVQKNAIRSFQSTDTRKLNIQLDPALDFTKDIFISKAKSPDFKNWFLNHPSQSGQQAILKET